MGMNNNSGTSVVLPFTTIPSCTSVSIPLETVTNYTLANGGTTSPTTSNSTIVPPEVTSTNVSSPHEIITASLAVKTTLHQNTTPSDTLPVVEPVIVCPVDGSRNAWQWEGSSFTKAVFCRSDGPPVVRTCYRAIRHRRDGMVIREKDCVLLCSGPDRSNPPHVAKITALFADSVNPETKMMSLLWYYRPEHVGCPPGNLVPNELYASRHCDTNPVECIEDKAYVLTASAFSRYMARLKYRQTAYPRPPLHRVVPICPLKSSAVTTEETLESQTPQEDSTGQSVFSEDVPESVNPSNVFLCRGVYDYRLKRVCRNVNLHVLPIHSHFLANRHRMSGGRSPSAHPPSLSPKVDMDEQERHELVTITCSPKPPILELSDPPVAVPVGPVPSQTPQSTGNQSPSTEPSPANSPSLCICLPDSPTPNGRSLENDSLANSPKSSTILDDTPAKSSSELTALPVGEDAISQPRVGSPLPAAPTDRSSTPLKGRESVSVSDTTCPPPKPLNSVNLLHADKLPATTTHTTSNPDPVIVHTTVSQPSLSTQLTSSITPHTNIIWVPSNPMMPLLESSVLETSADLSVNWAEH
ncbi:unnamed protein product, partial [Echinostoma caproni]|uniref:BAH domain-containing protein n=1 Tax=Echinostoma caproni TaxID=27848 RepID=A0A183AW97_9TREM